MDIPCFVITCIIYSKFRPLCLLSFFLCSCGTQANSWRNQKLAESHPPATLAGAPPEVYEEGNLERKHEWESSARKSSDRSWYSLFVVLRGGMLYSYKDQKQAKQFSCNAFYLSNYCELIYGYILFIITAMIFYCGISLSESHRLLPKEASNGPARRICRMGQRLHETSERVSSHPFERSTILVSSARSRMNQVPPQSPHSLSI